MCDAEERPSSSSTSSKEAGIYTNVNIVVVVVVMYIYICINFVLFYFTDMSKNMNDVLKQKEAMVRELLVSARNVEKQQTSSKKACSPLDLSLPREDAIDSGRRLLGKCSDCRRSRVSTPFATMRRRPIADGLFCDFCGRTMNATPALHPLSLPEAIQERRNCTGADDAKRTPTLSPSSLQRERATYESGRKYVKCSEPGCGTTLLNTSMKKHIRDRHSGDAYAKICPYCGKRLANSFSLGEHITAVHDRVAEHKCKICDMVFAYSANLNRHMRTNHEQRLVFKKYVNCHICGKQMQRNSLKTHLYASHGFTKRFFQCPSCDFKGALLGNSL